MSSILAEFAVGVGVDAVTKYGGKYLDQAIEKYVNGKNASSIQKFPMSNLSDEQQQALNKSCGEFKKLLEAEGTVNHVKISVACPEDGVLYSGKVVKTTDNHIFHEIGANNYVVHDKNDLSRIPKEGEHAVIQYRNKENNQVATELNQNLQSGISR